MNNKWLYMEAFEPVPNAACVSREKDTKAMVCLCKEYDLISLDFLKLQISQLTQSTHKHAASADAHTALHVSHVTDVVFPLPKRSCTLAAVPDPILETFLTGK